MPKHVFQTVVLEKLLPFQAGLVKLEFMFLICITLKPILYIKHLN